jgi:light-regulated signal transduction histidine kinase (bacteriophytochrome)
LRSRAGDDEEARVLATAFNTLTESIARFQREAAQKERLSSLGRLSTVIAHEIRNPLMIIRATLSTLMRDNVTSSEIREAAADIDDETKRLNRIVSEVLDFAKPIRFELAETRLNDILSRVCRRGMGRQDRRRRRARSRSQSAAGRHRRGAAAHGARQHPHQRANGHPANAIPDPTRSSRRPAIAVAARPGVIVRTRRHVIAWRHRLRSRHRHRTRGYGPHLRPLLHNAVVPATGLGLPIAKNIVEGTRRHHHRQQSCRPGERHRHRLADRADRGRRMTWRPVRGTILLADDEEKILKRLGRALRDEGQKWSRPRARAKRSAISPSASSICRRRQSDAGHRAASS